MSTKCSTPYWHTWFFSTATSPILLIWCVYLSISGTLHPLLRTGCYYTLYSTASMITLLHYLNLPLSLRTYLSRGCHRTVKAHQNQVRTCPLSLVRASLFYYILFQRKIALPETFYRSISLQRTELNWNKLNGLELTYTTLCCAALYCVFYSVLDCSILFCS